MNRHLNGILAAGAAALTCLVIAPGQEAQAAGGVSPALIATAAPTRIGNHNDFWEDRYNAMRKIWGTPYVPLGYYWNQANGLPPQPAEAAPGLVTDRPLYPYGAPVRRPRPTIGRGLGRVHNPFVGNRFGPAYRPAGVPSFGPRYGPSPVIGAYPGGYSPLPYGQAIPGW